MSLVANGMCPLPAWASWLGLGAGKVGHRSASATISSWLGLRAMLGLGRPIELQSEDAPRNTLVMGDVVDSVAQPQPVGASRLRAERHLLALRRESRAGSMRQEVMGTSLERLEVLCR